MKNSLFFAIITLVSFSSCNPRVYLPDRVNAPMIKEAGEVKLTSSLKVQTQTASKIRLSPSLDFAVSPWKGLGLMASYRGTSRFADEEDFDIFSNGTQDSIHYSGNKAEFGAGYYMSFGNRGHFDLYGGGGFGHIGRDNLKFSEGEYEADYYQFFIQPAIGLFAKDIFDFCGGIRFTYHKYNDFKSADTNLRYAFTEPSADIESPTFLILGPFVNFNVGKRFVKFNAQMGANVNVNSPQFIQNDNLPFYVSLGLTLGWAPRFVQ